MNFFRIFKKEQNGDDSTGKTGPGRQLSVVGEYPKTRIWAIGGGKGGVGKSLVASNLGILLARLGNRVLMVDADLGAANLHTLLGSDGSRLSLSNFLKSEVSDLRPLICKTGTANLDLVSGAKDSLDVADINSSAILRLRKALTKIEYDYVLLDIGPGTTANMLDLFLVADEGVLMTTPEPTSIENTYRFLKCLFLRRIRHIVNSQEDTRLKELLSRVFNGNWSQHIKTVADILHQLKQLDPERGGMLKEFMGNTSVSLIINQAKRPTDLEIGPSMKKACFDYFGIEVGHLGDICYEDCVADSIRQKTPLVVSYSQSGTAKALEACLQKLINNEGREKISRICR